MGRWIKRIIAAIAIKEGIERIQEARRPQKRRGRGLMRVLTLGAIGGGIAYLYKTGKLQPMLEQAKEMLGEEETAYGGDEGGDVDWSAPAASAGATTTGATSTSTSV